MESSQKTLSASELKIVSFLGEGQIIAHEQFSKGMFTIDQYKSILKERQNSYNRLLQNTQFNELDIYVSEFVTQDGNYYLVSGQEEKQEMIKLIMNAAYNKQIEFASAFTNTDLGTFFTVSVDNRNARKGDDIKMYRIFVSNLFKSSVQEVLLYIQQHQENQKNL